MDMKKLIWCAVAMLLLGCFAVAQNSQSNQGKQTSLSGCLSGPNEEGAYVLKTKSHSVEVGGADELKNHVGHEVKLTGSWAKSGTEIGESESAEKHEAAEKHEGAETKQAGEKGEGHGGQERHFKVAKIDHVAASCSAAK
jgi:hypothetical protein